MAAFPLVRLLPTLLLVGLLGHLLEVEADAVADAASSQVNFLGHFNLCNSKSKVEINTCIECTQTQYLISVKNLGNPSDPKFLTLWHLISVKKSVKPFQKTNLQKALHALLPSFVFDTATGAPRWAENGLTLVLPLQRIAKEVSAVNCTNCIHISLDSVQWTP